jgi:DNA-binding winged helix-turn-helix (wHTH) protein/tetratricopeptide (TPR) repeat protein
MPPNEPRYALGPYLVEFDTRRVTREGVPLKLAHRHFDALRLLIEANQQVVPKERFFQQLWPDAAIVDESNLTQCISQLRKALANGTETSFVETVQRVGYRLVVPVTRIGAHEEEGAPLRSGLPPPPLPAPSRRRWPLVAAMAIPLLAVVAGAGGWQWWQSRPAQLSRAAQQRGNELTRRGDIKAAVAEFQLAVRLDPSNANAYSELAFALNRLSFRDSAATPVGESPSVKAAARAVELDPQCGLCHATLGFFLFYHDWRWDAAEMHYKRALQLAPERPSIPRAYSMLLAATGRLDDALRNIDRALSRESYDVDWLTHRATVLYLARRYTESVAATDRPLAITQDERAPWEWRSKALFQLGRGEEAIKALAEVAFAEHSLRLETAVREGGRDAGLRTLLDITGDWRSHREQAWRRAPWRALLGDTGGALSELESAYDLRNVNLLYIGVDPVFDKIRDHPRFQRILRGMGLPAGITKE